MIIDNTHDVVSEENIRKYRQIYIILILTDNEYLDRLTEWFYLFRISVRSIQPQVYTRIILPVRRIPGYPYTRGSLTIMSFKINHEH